MALNLYVCLIVACSLTLAINGKGLIGGYRESDANGNEVQEAAKFAVKMYNKASNDVHLYKFIKVESAERQVVNGINNKLVVKIGRTSCQKNHANSCDGDSTVLQELLCTFVVYQTLPPPEYSLTKHECNPV
ncbi:cystatin-C-like [Dendropsophus ebraccatus]|uniref:cystatin-C-like n=1 Tax=Dendropsophus ebraccatus TaxID=150705 RepID=UPI003831C294